MKLVVTNPLCSKFLERGCFNFTAEHFRDAESCVIEQHDQNVRRVGRQSLWLSRPLHRRILQQRLDDTLHRYRRKWQHTAIILTAGDRVDDDEFKQNKKKGSHHDEQPV